MKDDAISRQAVLKLLAAMPPEEAITKAMLMQSVKQMAAAQSEVIHCKDCIYRSGRYCHYRYTFGLFIAENHYCKFAKRQEESK